jgi:ubiquinone/menaquinone biosynthesis C-methylase UbiE
MTYTHGHAESVLRSHRARTAANSAAYLLPYLRPTDRLLDVGSGPGTITADLAGLVAEVVAVEISDEAAGVTRNGLAERGVTNAEVRVGDVHALDLPDASYDVVHAHQVLQHVADPVGALREMRRVCRPDGYVAVRDSDYAAFTWYPEIPELTEWLALYQRLARANGGEPDAGRRLLSWAREAGYREVTATSSTWCFANEADRAWWGSLWADRLRLSAFGEQALASGVSRADLERLAAGWLAWADAPDGWLSILHGEILARP